MKKLKPEPVVTSTVCSLCGLDWNAHGNQDDGSWKEPTALDCIRLLCEEVAKRPVQYWTINQTAPLPWQGSSTVCNHTGPTTSGTLYLVGKSGPDEPPDMRVPAKAV